MNSSNDTIESMKFPLVFHFLPTSSRHPTNQQDQIQSYSYLQYMLMCESGTINTLNFSSAKLQSSQQTHTLISPNSKQWKLNPMKTNRSQIAFRTIKQDKGTIKITITNQEEGGEENSLQKFSIVTSKEVTVC